MARVRAGHQDALRDLYGRHGAAVLALARRIVGDAGLAEDVAQTVFVAVWQNADRYDPARGTVRTWLLTQAHGRSVDLVRSEARRRHREDPPAPAATIPDSTEHDAWLRLLRRDVRDALATLPASERDALLLAYFGGHSYREVAERLGAPEGTVKSRIRSGLGRLRDLLDPEDAA